MPKISFVKLRIHHSHIVLHIFSSFRPHEDQLASEHHPNVAMLTVIQVVRDGTILG